MKTIKQIPEIRNQIKEYKKKNKTIGFVPTMGYLHSGHISLVKKAAEENDIAVTSIFINPTQFGPSEDLNGYPRDLDRDLKMLKREGCNLVFSPLNKDIYEPGFETYISLKYLPGHLCGLSRPNHFSGVATIVGKLFNIIQPDKAYFGQKDYQQALVIKKMVRDLNFNVEIVICPIIREEDGLAMSSRNIYLKFEERRDAVLLHRGLEFGVRELESGKRDISGIILRICNMIEKSPHARIDYISIVNGETLEEIENPEKYHGPVLLAGAVWFGKARLIDNSLTVI